jgi:iron uptake system EfeUOB component EfeO/EfeM
VAVRRARRTAVIAATALLALAGCTGHDGGEVALTVSRSGCATEWHDPHGGEQTFRVHNVGINTTEVELVDPANGAVYAELENLGPGSTRPMQVTLGRGRYAFRCLPEDTDAVTGPTVTVTDGPKRGAPAIVPVDEQVLRGPVDTYRSSVQHAFPTLRRDVRRLAAAVRSGDRAAARRAWLPAHLDYERLGAAYGTFGDLADAIDRLPAGLPKGVHDPGFTGFHRIEYGLWHGESLPALRKPADALSADVAKLVTQFRTERVDPNDLPLRAHEILEMTLQFELTGEADQGSGTTLATARANVDGTVAVLDALRPVLKSRFRGLPEADAAVHKLRTLLDAQYRHGTWTPVGELSAAQRRAIDGAAGEALERLAPIAALAQVRRAQ